MNEKWEWEAETQEVKTSKQRVHVGKDELQKTEETTKPSHSSGLANSLQLVPRRCQKGVLLNSTKRYTTFWPVGETGKNQPFQISNYKPNCRQTQLSENQITS